MGLIPDSMVRQLDETALVMREMRAEMKKTNELLQQILDRLTDDVVQ